MFHVELKIKSEKTAKNNTEKKEKKKKEKKHIPLTV
jgi:hypothetical protein